MSFSSIFIKKKEFLFDSTFTLLWVYVQTQIAKGDFNVVCSQKKFLLYFACSFKQKIFIKDGRPSSSIIDCASCFSKKKKEKKNSILLLVCNLKVWACYSVSFFLVAIGLRVHILYILSPLCIHLYSTYKYTLISLAVLLFSPVACARLAGWQLSRSFLSALWARFRKWKLRKKKYKNLTLI